MTYDEYDEGLVNKSGGVEMGYKLKVARPGEGMRRKGKCPKCLRPVYKGGSG